MIKQYDQLSIDEKQELRNFITSQDSMSDEDYENYLKMIEGPAFGKGSSFFANFSKGSVTATLGLVELEIPVKGEAFITAARGESADVMDILDVCMKRITSQMARKAIMGIKPRYERILSEISQAGFIHTHNLVNMEKNLEKVELDKADESITKLTPEHIDEFVRANNSAFLDSPNGATMQIEQANEYLDSGAPVVYLLLEGSEVRSYCILNGNGLIDTVGTDPLYKKKGYATRMLRYAQQHFKSIGIEKAHLTVIDINKPALNLYLSEGFEITGTASCWFTKVLR